MYRIPLHKIKSLQSSILQKGMIERIKLILFVLKNWKTSSITYSSRIQQRNMYDAAMKLYILHDDFGILFSQRNQHRQHSPNMANGKDVPCTQRNISNHENALCHSLF